MASGVSIPDAMENLALEYEETDGFTEDQKRLVAGLREVRRSRTFQAAGILADLYSRSGDKRVKDTPITESAIIGTAVGAATAGLRPVIELMFVDFIGVALDQLYNQAGKMKYMFGGKAKIPMVLRATCGAGIGAAAQHSQCLEALFMHLPGLKVVLPSTPYDAKGLLMQSIRDENPVVFQARPGTQTKSGAGRNPFRHARHLGVVEPHRPAGARHRTLKRLPHDAV